MDAAALMGSSTSGELTENGEDDLADHPANSGSDDYVSEVTGLEAFLDRPHGNGAGGGAPNEKGEVRRIRVYECIHGSARC